MRPVSRLMFVLFIASALGGVAGCSAEKDSTDAGPAADTDAGAFDAGAFDAGAFDAGGADAGVCTGGAQACTSSSECPAPATACLVATCDEGCCLAVNQPLGTVCSDHGGVVCNGSGACVAEHCMDGTQDSDESDKDCGGSSCTPCPSLSHCKADADCKSGRCDEGTNPGVCIDCEQDADCPPTGNECVAAVCSDKLCGTANLGDTHVSALDKAGDCQKHVCDGNGGVTTVNDDTDKPISNTLCLVSPSCTNGIPGFTPAAANTDCSADNVPNASRCGEPADPTVAGTCVQCNAASDCPQSTSPCAAAFCDKHVCGFSFSPSGLLDVALQVAGDCQQIVCDGNGHDGLVEDSTDLPAVTSVCQLPQCTSGNPSVAPAAADVDCSADGVPNASHCGDPNDSTVAGTCVQCNDAADCPQSSNGCMTATCDQNVCGFANRPFGYGLLTGQSSGDCQKLVCNGNGGITTVDDATDLPVSNSVCQTYPSCVGPSPLTPHFDGAAKGTDCSADGLAQNHLCGDPNDATAAGTCVQCNDAADCPQSSNGCMTATCDQNVCGFANRPFGYGLLTGQSSGDCQKLVCNGNGGITSVDDATDLPVSNTMCLISPSCTGAPLMPQFTPAAKGANCAGDGIPNTSRCGDPADPSVAGTCVQCNQPSDCPGSVGICGMKTCTDHVCGVAFQPSGYAPSALQTPGDCQKIVCTGSSSTGVTPADDATDLPVSNSTCQTYPSCAGAPLTPHFDPAPTGIDCSADGQWPSKVCGSTSDPYVAGTCVECNVNADCTSPMTCDSVNHVCQ